MNPSQLSIKSWPESERPRERLIKQGVRALSDAELLSILLRTGIPGKDALQLARELLKEHGGWRGLLALGAEDLGRVRGLGPSKAAALLAVAEIAKRQLREDLIGRHFIRDPRSIVDYLYGSLRDCKKEVFKVLFLNKANRILAERDLFEGTVDETAVHVREVVRAALQCHATALVLVHNHPSGRTEPSRDDRLITAKIADACATVAIKVLDHIIVGDNQYFSFREQQQLPVGL
ncbi:MAG: DNA repair protein RadC [Candidatus Omnitrophica bacterium]|nr:DNA repair protein RadC [Candidatus Omnitrophota bacterium]